MVFSSCGGFVLVTKIKKELSISIVNDKWLIYDISQLQTAALCLKLTMLPFQSADCFFISFPTDLNPLTVLFFDEETPGEK